MSISFARGRIWILMFGLYAIYLGLAMLTGIALPAVVVAVWLIVTGILAIIGV